jgi:hypothetical protein
MRLQSIVIASAVLSFAAGVAPFSRPVLAQDAMAREAELAGLHQLCDRGDRKACVRFGMALGAMRERHVEWRRTHPEWFWWDR